MKKDTARILITDDCNLKCPHCINKVKEVRETFIPWDRENLKAFPYNKYEKFIITGGEPLLRKTLMYMLLQYIPIEKDIYLNTNGFLLTDSIFKILRDTFTIQGITINLKDVNSFTNLKLSKKNQTDPIIRYNIPAWMYTQFRKNHSYHLKISQMRKQVMDNRICPNEDIYIIVKEEK